jgi:hypothetical protein
MLLTLIVLIPVASPSFFNNSEDPTAPMNTGADIQISDVSVDKSSASVNPNAIIKNNGEDTRTVEIEIQVVVGEEIVNTHNSEIQLSADSTERVAPLILIRQNEMSSNQRELYKNDDIEVKFLIDGETKASVTEFGELVTG